MNGGTINNGLSLLRELTEQLPPFPAAIGGEGGYREYQMDKGDCFAWFIHRSGNDIAIHRWFNSKGTIFPEHAHPEREWIIVYEGCMELTCEGITKRLEKGDFYFFEPGQKHHSYFPEDCKYITVMIPPSKEYPDVSG